MANREQKLPEFANPPVIETLIGVQFDPIDKLTIPLLGYFWGKVRDQYPTCDIKPALGPIVEEFGSAIKPPKIQFSLEEIPSVRFWFVTSEKTRLLQIQNDRFIHNWRKVQSSDEYPRFSSVRSTFEKEWLRFSHFLEEEKIDMPVVNQCEVTYVNHIEPGTAWKKTGEIEKVISHWSSVQVAGFLPEPEIVNIHTRFLLPDSKGRLYIVLEPAIRRRDVREVLQLNLTVRGKPDTSKLEDILSFFDLGHEWLVRGFTDFTTKEMHKLWGIRE